MKHGSSHSPRSGRERSQRQLRVGELLRHALVRVLERDGIRDPDLADVSVTVTEVQVSPDLRNATAYIVPLGGGNMDTVVGALRRAAPYLRRRLAGHVKIRRLPGLSFMPDVSFDRAARIDHLLERSDSAEVRVPEGAGEAEGDGP